MLVVAGHSCLSFHICVAHIEERDPAHLFATVTRDLANKDPCWKSSLADAITKNKDISTTPSVTGHFQKFFRNIAHDSCMSFMGPIAIVIDGLDESKAGDPRKLLLKILQHEVSQLPSNFRFLITLRSDQDIYKTLINSEMVQCMDDLQATDEDIKQYIHSELSPVLQNDPWWNNKNGPQYLATLSEGLFQWATTVCNLVREPSSPVSSSEQL